MKSIRWKLVLTSLLVVFVPIWLLNRYALDFFDRFTRTALEKSMIDDAFIIGEQYKTLVLAAPTNTVAEATEEYGRLLRVYGPQAEARLCLLDTNGVVLFDSDRASMVGEDLSARREIRKALGGRYGARAARTPDRQYMYYYVALPVERSNDTVAVAYVMRHTAPIIGALKRMVVNQRLAATLALVVAALIAIVLAQTLTRRLRALTKAAVAFAKGAAAWPAPARGRDEIGELGRAMDQMATELEKRNRSSREFVAAAVHELKTPLTAVKGTVEILEDGAADDPETRRRFLANIRYETERMIRLVGELNELGKLDVESLRGQTEPVDYGAFVRAVADRLAPTFEEPHAVLRLNLPEKTITVRIVPGRIEQVIANLLDNAFRYSPASGEVELRVAEGVEGAVWTSVRDTGSGIAPANLAKVFDRFFTTEPKDQPGHPHSGLGLAIAKSIIENHQGQISVESVPGQGACFSFSLPAA